MMKPEVYERIYAAACAAPGDVFVEVGTGHGAGTVCLALALRDTGRAGMVHTIDRFEGGSRAHYGDIAMNQVITEEAIKHFGVADRVTVWAGDSAGISDIRASEIGLLMLDADGRIDRDLGIYYDRLVPDAVVIVDDVADRARARDVGGGMVRVDQKHRITNLLVASAERHGLLVAAGTANVTWFGKRGSAWFADWPMSAVLDCYRQLVFANAERC